MRRRHLAPPTLALAGAALTSGLPANTVAQEPLALEEVLVTAQRRTESLQDVPISIIAMEQQALEMRGIDEIEDIWQAIDSNDDWSKFERKISHLTSFPKK